MDDDRLDLGALDPRRDPKRWEALVQATSARAVAAALASARTVRPIRLGDVLRQQGRVALALAASIAVLMVGAAYWRGSPDSSTSRMEPAQTTLGWVASSEAPSAEEALSVWGGGQ